MNTSHLEISNMRVDEGVKTQCLQLSSEQISKRGQMKIRKHPVRKRTLKADLLLDNNLEIGLEAESAIN